uniref:Uncharacterized protein n=1 Tax=Pristionchus pacificus TaxID=54126 RepID=A0A2A6C1E6_PRIPA|eukprot:PDM71960.1 hypothetical protein PRIPAC_38367 [Pristionchus pacificus]
MKRRCTLAVIVPFGCASDLVDLVSATVFVSATPVFSTPPVFSVFAYPYGTHILPVSGADNKQWRPEERSE